MRGRGGHPPAVRATASGVYSVPIMTPRIGITTFSERKDRESYASVNDHYVRSVRAGGGLPLLFPPAADESEWERYADLVDGVLFSGGGDLSPNLFGEDPVRGVNRISESRDRSEFALFRAARERRLPVLGICRGIQVVNVAMGGTLWQDIPTQVQGAQGHYPDGIPTDEPYHRVEILPGDTRLRRMFGAGPIRTNSFHHQAVRDLAPGLVVTARTADGIVEALESRDPAWFLVGVQFHPEAQTLRDPSFVKLFAALAEAAAREPSGMRPSGDS